MERRPCLCLPRRLCPIRATTRPAAHEVGGRSCEQVVTEGRWLWCADECVNWVCALMTVGAPSFPFPFLVVSLPWVPWTAFHTPTPRYCIAEYHPFPFGPTRMRHQDVCISLERS
ncbi:hypothetical protein BU14_0072s0004 [Porphyra umbilicalis]|uniref:Uncharacterized protein n=1 Tax=Porphyra umbilicalis TaxID=2786 RepID=A0A1X6PFX5_PORUM|nr:hypothetical protein BU14_0072s0004 [Porphyra umbilicalis]|eukprot:OSX79646.1 hypothetical protein BU14_0072s0004 [Porphyra umbilicalis]